MNEELLDRLSQAAFDTFLKTEGILEVIYDEESNSFMNGEGKEVNGLTSIFNHRQMMVRLEDVKQAVRVIEKLHFSLSDIENEANFEAEWR